MTVPKKTMRAVTTTDHRRPPRGIANVYLEGKEEKRKEKKRRKKEK